MILENLKQLTSLMSGKQREYYDALVASSHVIECEKMADVLPEKIYQRIIAGVVPIQKKECFKNATLVSLTFPDVKYVEGQFECCGIPIDHAWNEYNGHYFDVTREVVLKDDISGEYVAFTECESSELLDILMECRYYGDVFRTKFLKSKK